MRQQVLIILLLLSVVMWAEAPSGYYNNANGKTGKALLETLHDIIDNHNDHGYDALKEGYKSTDKKPNGNVWDIYSDVPGGTPPYEFQFGNTCGQYSNEGDCYNREHTFPQSWFDKSSPMRNDIIHVLPTDGKVNGMRSNYPYGEVSSPSKTSLNGSKLGPNTSSGYSSTVFEPLDEYKGDLARIYFYMAARYNDKIAGWQNNGTADAVLAGNNFPVYDQWHIDLLLKWHSQDPVSDKETNRNDACYSYQGNRNPFVDHPEWVCSVWGGDDCSSGGGGTENPDSIDATADVTITMSKSDYQIIVDYVNAHLTNTDDHPDNTENYYGASAFYSNFDLRTEARNAKFSTADEAIVEALGDVFLPAKVTSSLVNKDFIINYATYDGVSSGNGSKTYHCVSTDPLSFALGAATEEPTDTTIVLPPTGLALANYGTDSTFDVVTWNIEHFPKNDSITIAKVKTTIEALDAEVIAVQEVDDTAAFFQLVREMPTYTGLVTASEYANLGYIIKSDLKVNSFYTIYKDEWSAFPRRPLVLDVSYDGENFIIINNHLKCCGDGVLDVDNTNDEEYRRQQACIKLKSYIDNNFADKAVLVLGDFNDILSDATSNNVFQNFLADEQNYTFADMAIAKGSSDYWSYKSWPSHLDHILVTNEVFGRYDCTTILLDTFITWSEYDTDISDHRPVGIRIVSAEEDDEAASSLNLTFDNGLDDCVVFQVSGTTTWGQAVYNDNGYAVINTYQEGANEAWLITPAVDMNAIDNKTFSFSMTSYNSNKKVGECGAGQFELYYSSNFNGSTINAFEWTRISTVDNVQLGNDSWVWVNVPVDVSNITGGEVYFAFAHRSDENNGTTWEIDNVILNGNVIDDLRPAGLEPIALYPNPTSVNFSLSEDINILSLYSLSGKMIDSYKNVKAHQEINLRTLAPGVYIVKMQKGDSVFTHRLIKE